MALLILSQCFAIFKPPLKRFHLYIFPPPAIFHCTLPLPAYLYPPYLSHTFLSLSPSFSSFYFFLFFPLWKCNLPLTSLHLSLSLSLFVFPRAYLSVIWRMGLQHRGQGTWCSGCHCYGDLHHDAGPGATHPAKVKLPRNTWQKELQYWPLQGNPEVSQCWGDAWSGESRSEGMGYTNTNMGKVNWKCGRKITSPNKVNQT